MWILASASPRRQELFAHLKLPFKVHAANIDEAVLTHETPEAYVQRLAEQKACAVAAFYPTDHILAADTTVVADGHILGKPSNIDDAIKMWTLLNGKTHQVYTGVAVKNANRLLSTVVKTSVTFGAMSPEEMQSYWASGEPADKAGAYAIQGIGGQFVEKIDGSYSNVVGLPLSETKALMRLLGTND